MSISLLLFLGLYAGGIILTVVKDLTWGVALYELLYFIFPASRWWYTLPRFRFTLVIALIMMGVFLFKKKKALLNLAYFPQIKWLLFMIAMMGLISFWAVWPEEHHRFLLLQIQQFVFMYIAYHSIDSEKKLDRVLWAFLVGCFYVGYLAYSFPRNEFGRLEGIGMPDGKESNTTAAVLITSVPLLLHYLFNGNNIKRIVALIFFPFVVNAIILLNSRGAFIALILAMSYYVVQLCLRGEIDMKYRISTLLATIVCIIIFFYLADNTFWNRMSTLISVTPGEGTATRTEFWKVAWGLVRQNPFGLGARGFEYLSPQLLPEEWLSPTSNVRATHSTYFEALVEFGYAGILIIGGFVFSTFSQTRKIRKQVSAKGDSSNYSKALALESAFIGFLLASIFIDRLYAEIFYWQMTFIACHTKLLLSPEYDTNKNIGVNCETDSQILQQREMIR